VHVQVPVPAIVINHSHSNRKDDQLVCTKVKKFLIKLNKIIVKNSDLINSSATESSSLSMIASSPPAIHLPVPDTTNSHNGNFNGNCHSPIFGVGIGVLLGQPLTPNALAHGNGYGYGGHRRVRNKITGISLINKHPT
jgi:hypothetical protein